MYDKTEDGRDKPNRASWRNDGHEAVKRAPRFGIHIPDKCSWNIGVSNTGVRWQGQAVRCDSIPACQHADIFPFLTRILGRMWVDAVKPAGEIVGSTGKKKIHGTEGEDGIGGRRNQRQV